MNRFTASIARVVFLLFLVTTVLINAPAINRSEGATDGLPPITVKTQTKLVKNPGETTLGIIAVLIALVNKDADTILWSDTVVSWTFTAEGPERYKANGSATPFKGDSTNRQSLDVRYAFQPTKAGAYTTKWQVWYEGSQGKGTLWSQVSHFDIP
ncbi:MAG: hypothetical protein H8F28_08220 [Fibrella sp.]|nr:hypothetical protein [Armatimonadota bacterium]